MYKLILKMEKLLIQKVSQIRKRHAQEFEKFYSQTLNSIKFNRYSKNTNYFKEPSI